MDLLYCILYSSAGNTGADKCKRLQKAKTKQTLLKTTVQLFMLTNTPQSKLFLSLLHQISTNFNNFRQKMAKAIELCVVHSFTTSPNLC